MDTKRKDWLYSQYVLALQSDGEWDQRAQRAIAHKNFGQFRRYCGDAINRVKLALSRADMDNSFDEADRTYVILTLWDEAGGDLTDSSSDYRYYLQRAINHSLSFAGLKLNAANNTLGSNPCGEVFLTELPASPFDTIEENQTMNINANAAFVTKRYVFGQDVDQMSEEQLIGAIKKIEAEIDNLKAVKTASKKITGKVAELEEMLANVVAVLDAK